MELMAINLKDEEALKRTINYPVDYVKIIEIVKEQMAIQMNKRYITLSNHLVVRAIEIVPL